MGASSIYGGGEKREVQRPVVLYVEDDLPTIEAVRTILARSLRHVSLITVHDGESAMALLAGEGPYAGAAKEPDLILLDLHLPRKDGWMVLREVRERSLSGAPVVIFSSSDSAANRDRAARNGAMFFHKAPELEALEWALMRICDLAYTAMTQAAARKAAARAAGSGKS